MLTLRSRSICAGFVWVWLAACPHRAAPPEVPVPAVLDRVDADLALPASRVAFRVHVDLATLSPVLAELLNQRLSLQQTEWTRVTAEGANPEVETRMQARIETPRMRMLAGRLEVEVPIAYWGRVRAQAKTPFGKLWLSQGLDWGTEASPGKILLLLRAVPTLDQRFQLSTQSTLVDVKLEAPQGDALCGRMVIKVCVQRDAAAREVHAQLEKQIRKSAPGLLAALDQRIAREVEFGQLIERGLSTLRGESSLYDHTLFAIEPVAIATGTFEGTGSTVELAFELGFIPRFRTVSAGMVPANTLARSELSKSPSELHFDLGVSFAQLSELFSRAFAGVSSAGHRVQRVDVLGVSAAVRDAVVLAVTLVRDTTELTVYMSAVPTLNGASLGLQQITLSADSERALATQAIEGKRLIAALSVRAHVDLAPAVLRRVQQVRARLAVPLALFGRLELALPQPTLEGPRYAASSVLLRVHGQAHVQLEP